VTARGTDLQEIDCASPAAWSRLVWTISPVEGSPGARPTTAVRRWREYGPGQSRGRSISLLLTMLLVAIGCETNASAPPPSSPFPEPILQRMLAEHADEHNAGVIALVKTDGAAWSGGAGDYQGKRQADPGDLFDIGSTGKTFLATVVLQLVEEGRFSLDDSVERWLPGEVDGGRRVLVRHLLNHTSGLTVSPSGGGISVVNPPGTRYGYSNVDYGLLGGIVSKVTGRRPGQEVRDRILVPLGLENFWLTFKDASGHWLGVREGSCALCFPVTTGGVSTTSDLARFFQALLSGELLGPEMMAEMTETVPTGTEMHAGLGMFRFDLPCGSAWGHGGDFTYYTNQVLVSEDGSKALVVARNVRDWYSIKILAEEMYCQAF
jgi:D-alanyl-D-alanine carboxypeptidase